MVTMYFRANNSCIKDELIFFFSRSGGQTPISTISEIKLKKKKKSENLLRVGSVLRLHAINHFSQALSFPNVFVPLF